MWLWMIQTLYYVVKEKVLLYWHLLIASTDKACQAKLVYILQENPKMRANLIMLEGSSGYALTESKASKQSLWHWTGISVFAAFWLLLLYYASVESLHYVLVLLIVLLKQADWWLYQHFCSILLDLLV